uniref:Uncharacterized protein n=1 Tax=Seriola lalandi dorsalis TaxID=1841481 RepID=A0A3B4XFP0_SERLL
MLISRFFRIIIPQKEENHCEIKSFIWTLRHECLQRGVLFEDPDFPAADDSQVQGQFPVCDFIPTHLAVTCS